MMVVPEKQQLYTVEEFELFLAQPENEERLFELIFGEIVEKMPTELHAAIVGLIVGHLFVYFQQNPIGWALPEARYRVKHDQHNARMPDIAVIVNRTRPLVEQGAAPGVPDLAIEIQSPDDSLKKMTAKADYYLANGAQQVWLVYPHKKLVEVLTPDDRQLLTLDDSLDGGDLLPDLKIAVRDIFPQQ